MFNTETNKTSRIFTTSNGSISIIARTACNEFGFIDYKKVIAKPVSSDIRNKFTRSKVSNYLNFINRQSISGLECTGLEASIKDCRSSSNASYETDLFELEIECLGIINISNKFQTQLLKIFYF